MTAEKAYQDIATALLSTVRGEDWSSVEMLVKSHEAMIEEALTVRNGSSIDRSKRIDSSDMADSVIKPCDPRKVAVIARSMEAAEAYGQCLAEERRAA